MVKQILKGKDVIRILGLFFLLVSTIKLASQEKIVGNYKVIYRLNETYSSYVFNDEGTFTFESGGDVAISSLAKGNYTRTKDSLILNYNLTELKENSYYKSKSYYNRNDSISIKIKTYNFDKSTVNKAFFSTYPNSRPVDPDKNAITEFKFKKGSRKDVVEIIVEAEFYDRLDMSLSLDKNYEIDVFLSTSKNVGFYHPKAIKHQIEKYKIVEFSEDYITLMKDKKILKLKKVD